jgi:2-succinyl-5-enolpyruvyl-6-hydroxy-3-cyclohexene-1-carboxylate synthase
MRDLPSGMPKTTDKIHIQHLVEICYQKGLTEVVLSPGSRNAPLAIAFDARGVFNIHVVVDERVAAFYALGKAQQNKTGAILICTSGTALLNYGPAVAEAYYQRIPLLILSADRPAEWIDQGAGQSIRQANVYANFIRSSYTLPQIVEKDSKNLWYSNRLVNEGINKMTFPVKGPVHINIPLSEPLYNRTEPSTSAPKIQHIRKARLAIDPDTSRDLISKWHKASHKLIFCASHAPNSELSEILEQLQERDDVVIWTENLSNVIVSNQLGCVDRFIESVEEKDWEILQPDVLLTLGDAVVSKKFRFLMRRLRPLEHWHVSDEVVEVDRYMALNETIHAKPAHFCGLLLPEDSVKAKPYQAHWHERYQWAKESHAAYLATLPFCDMTVFHHLMQKIPPGMLQLGNSTVVRYSQLFDRRPDLQYFSNRGTSGIDGSTSTAMGAASVFDGNCTFITGDLSFLYDSNALWSRTMPENLKVIIMNNGGGSIFKVIEGPRTHEKVEEYFVAPHEVDLPAFIQSMGKEALVADDVSSLEEGLEELYKNNRYSFLVVNTGSQDNEQVLKNYFKYLKS